MSSYARSNNNRIQLLLILFTMLTTTLCCISVVAQSTQKIFYAPKEVTLEGTIVPQVFPGRPNYSSVTKGDKPEKEWILHLKKPVELEAGKNTDVAEKNVRKVQLVKRLNMVTLGVKNLKDSRNAQWVAFRDLN